MQIILKGIVSLSIILMASTLARRFPSVGGLIAVMPLTGALVLAWVHVESGGNPAVMEPFTKGALFGLVPSIIFFLVAFIGVRRHWPLAGTMGACFASWCVAALAHQMLAR